MSNEEPKQEMKEREVKVQGSTQQPTLEISSPNTATPSHVANSTPPPDYFSPVLSTTGDGPADVLQGLLDSDSHKNLSQTSRSNRVIYDVETTYKKLLREKIGPDPARLRNDGETYQAAYQRHLTMIRGLAPLYPGDADEINAALAQRFAMYPHYHFRALMTADDLTVITINSDPIMALFDNFPQYGDRIIEFALADPAAFACLLRDDEFCFIWFAEKLPAYGKRILEQVLADPAVFAGVIGNNEYSPERFMRFVKIFPDNGERERIMERILTEPAVLAGVVSSVDSLLLFAQDSEFPPAYCEQIIKGVLAGQTASTWVTQDLFSLMGLVRMFPAYGKLILEYILTEPMAFDWMTQDLSSFEGFVTYFPAYGKRMLEQVLADPAAFARMTQEDGFSFMESVEKFSKKIVEEFGGDLPNYSERILEQVLADPAAFTQTVRDLDSLGELIERFLPFAKQIIEHVFASEAAFARVVKNRNHFKKLFEGFVTVPPEHAAYVEGLFAAREAKQKNRQYRFSSIATREIASSQQGLQLIPGAKGEEKTVRRRDVARISPLSPTAPASSFGMFSSSRSSQTMGSQQGLQPIPPAQGVEETKPERRQSASNSINLEAVNDGGANDLENQSEPPALPG